MDDESAELAEYSKFYIDSLPRVVALLVTAGFSVHDAADCAQEAMIAALPPKWTTLVNPLGWVKLVAFRRGCDLMRRQDSSPIPHPDCVGAPLVASLANLDDIEHRHDLLYWLGRLSNMRQRQALAWLYDGGTTAEIADALEMTPDGVRSLIRDARAALRRLRNCGGGERQ